jgi:hypothetical protein
VDSCLLHLVPPTPGRGTSQQHFHSCHHCGVWARTVAFSSLLLPCLMLNL